MADERYVIDVSVGVEDATEPGLTQAEQRVTKFQKSVEKSQQQVQRMNKTKLQLTANAIDRASKVLDKVEARARSMTGKSYNLVVKVRDLATAPLNKLMGFATSYQAYMAAFAVGAVGYAAIAWPLKLADNLQSANIAFTTMLGSAQKAQQFMKQVQQFAIATPFSTEDIIKNAQFMMALGFQANQVIPSLQAIGDAASAMGGSADIIQRIILALGQMQAHGKVDAQDMLQLTSANIPAWKILADSIHKSVGETQKLAQAGKLEAAPAVQAILQGMERLYGGQMQKNANATFSGLMSQITDTFKIDIVTRWGQGIERAVLPALAKFNDWLSNNQNTINRWGDALSQAAQRGAQWVVDKVKAITDAMNTLVNSQAWQQADTFGEKMQVAWDQIIVAPFDSWWHGGGQQKLANIAAGMGRFLGGMLHGAIMGALGMTDSPMPHTTTISTAPAASAFEKHLPLEDRSAYNQSFQKQIDTDVWVSAGQTAGSAFFSAFAKAFNADEIAGKLLQAFGNIQPSPNHSTGGNILGGVIDLWLLSKGWKFGKGIKDKFGGGSGSVTSVPTAVTNVENTGPKTSGLVDKYGKPIPSVLNTAEQVATKPGFWSKVFGVGKNVLHGVNVFPYSHNDVQNHVNTVFGSIAEQNKQKNQQKQQQLSSGPKFVNPATVNWFNQSNTTASDNLKRNVDKPVNDTLQKSNEWGRQLSQNFADGMNQGSYAILEQIDRWQQMISAGLSMSASSNVVSINRGRSHITAYAKGGVINEPVMGTGLRSGTNYMFGEAGPEMVTPLGKVRSSGTGGSTGTGGVQVTLGSGSVVLSVTVQGGDGASVMKAIEDNKEAIAHMVTDAVAHEMAVQFEHVHANLPA